MASRIRWASVLPVALVTAAAAASVATAWWRVMPPVDGLTLVAFGAAALVAVIALVMAFVYAHRLGRRWDRILEEREIGYRQRIEAARGAVLQLHATTQWLLDQVRSGERPAMPGAPPPLPADIGDPFTLLHDAVTRTQHAIQLAVASASAMSTTTGPAGQVDVFVNLSHRLQGLVIRTIQVLDDMYRQLEDPELLAGLYQIDHLVTRMRRHAENLAVLGGAVTRRQWTTPQAISEVLRSATAEVEQFGRVKLVPPMKGTLAGHAVADVVHLVAELIENATNFSAPETSVMVSVDGVAAGVVIEIDDRGLGMQRDDLERVNALLADPHGTDLVALLRDGRLGHYVVSRLAGRHDIKVQLQRNIYGGTQAAVVLPHGMLGQQVHLAEAAMLTTSPLPPPAPQVDHAPPGQPAPVLASEVAAIERTTGSSVLVPTYVVPAQATQVIPATYEVIEAPQPSTPAQVRDVVVELRPPAPADQRPELPRRVSQAHLAPPLREAAPAPQAAEPGAGHDPRLMADYRRGFAQLDDGTEPEPPGGGPSNDRAS